MHKRVTARVGVIAIGVLLVVLLGLAACTRSKLGPVPTLEVTKQAQVGETRTPGATIVITTDATPTSEGEATPTVVIPSMTPTLTPTVSSPTATPTVAVPPPTKETEFEYTVKTGDTLWGLAIRFGTTVEAIKTRNNLQSNVIYKGQKLIIAGTESGETITHVVQPGENLFRISLKYGTTVEAIAAANNIINPSFVYAGQKLLIRKGSTVPGGVVRYHVVQPGETLWSISMKYGTTPWKIAAVNGISNINFIYAGHTLRIP
jgi:LysM repeat protein